MKGRKFFTKVLALSMFAALLAALPAGAAQHQANSRPSTMGGGATLVGTVNMRELAASAKSGLGDRAVSREFRQGGEFERPRSGPARGLSLPNPDPTPVVQQDTPGFFGHPGITFKEQRETNHGNHYSVEPPDQALCQANGVTFELVNSALRFYDSNNGTALTPAIDINEFYLLPPAIDRTNKPHFPGPFSGDGQCEYDKGSGRWFITSWMIAQDPVTGASTGVNNYYTAVSQTSDPLGNYVIFKSNADTPHPGDPDPRAGDHPFIGTDGHVFVIQDNEFSFFGDGFFGSVLHVFSKAAMIDGRSTPEVIIRPGAFGGGLSYSLQPATVPPGGSYETAQNGTLYFASALDFNGAGDDRIGLWALTNTSAIDSPDPTDVALQSRILSSEVYANPAPITQKPGPTPLGDSVGESINHIDAGSDETQPTKWAAGVVSTVIDTALQNGTDGLAWFQIDPGFDGNGNLTGIVVHQGYVAIAQGSLTYGSVAVTAGGRALLAMDLAGGAYYPSMSYGILTPGSGLDAVHLAATGTKPEDGFTCYAAFTADRTRGCRWGDYTDANVGTDGDFYFAGEYIGDLPRRTLGNWDTFIGSTP